MLQCTQGKYIVEVSRKDTFWGTKRANESLIGQNILGKLWMRIREQPPINPIPPKIDKLKLLEIATDDMRF